jgi:hypothetical protein
MKKKTILDRNKNWETRCYVVLVSTDFKDGRRKLLSWLGIEPKFLGIKAHSLALTASELLCMSGVF